MQHLVGILGHSVTSESVRQCFSPYLPLAAEVLDLAPEEGMPKDFYIFNTAAGICIKHEEDGDITTVFLHSQGHDGYSCFDGELGFGLAFSLEPSAVRRALGAPSFEREEKNILGFGTHGEILRYDYPAYSIHLQFSVGIKALEMVTLMAAKVVSDRHL